MHCVDPTLKENAYLLVCKHTGIYEHSFRIYIEVNETELM